MKAGIPEPIKHRLTLFCTTIFAVSLFGCIWAVASKDNIALFLSIGVAIAGLLRIIGVYRLARDKEYDTISGSVLADSKVAARRRHRLSILTDAQEEIVIILNGRATYQAGSRWILYVTKTDHAFDDLQFPESLKPSRILLGRQMIQ